MFLTLLMFRSVSPEVMQYRHVPAGRQFGIGRRGGRLALLRAKDSLFSRLRAAVSRASPWLSPAL